MCHQALVHNFEILEIGEIWEVWEITSVDFLWAKNNSDFRATLHSYRQSLDRTFRHQQLVNSLTPWAIRRLGGVLDLSGFNLTGDANEVADAMPENIWDPDNTITIQ
jgi:hypothetical protein